MKKHAPERGPALYQQLINHQFNIMVVAVIVMGLVLYAG